MSQLQFCSDKCLNQYKMQIFCKETQAHLEMNPHLKDKGKVTADNLITPDLWMKNCRSRSMSPESDRSRSSSPHPPAQQPPHKPPDVIGPKTPVHKPMISVAPPSKLMSRHSLGPSKIPPKNLRKRRPVRNLSSSSSLNSIIHPKSPSVISPPANHIGGKPCTVTSAQDLRVNLQAPPEKSPLRHQDYQFMTAHQPPPQLPPNMFMRQPTHMPPSPRFMPPQMPTNLQQHPFSLHNEPPRLPPFGQNPPPITILVPYPVVIPLPIPIPIPFPIRDFVSALRHEKSNEDNNNETNKSESEKSENEPLDFTKSRGGCTEEEEEIRKVLLESKIMAEQLEIDEEEAIAKLDRSPITLPPSKSSAQTPPRTNTPGEMALVVEKPVEQKLPKLKITRLDSKRMVSTTNVETTLVNDEQHSKESESSRPLRKRRRVFNCENHK